MTTNRFQRADEVERLNSLKRGVDLAALATERYGFRIAERNRDESYKLEHEGTQEKLIVKRAPEGWQMYFNANDDTDKGSVVDFLQKRHPGTNLGQVKGMLQEMVPGAAKALDYERFQQQQVQRPATASEQRYEALPAGERRAAMVRDTTGPQMQLTDSSYLRERGLTQETINDPAFHKRVFTDQHPDRQRDSSGQPVRNTGFPFFNQQGVQSWELRNRPQPGEEASFKMMMKGPNDGYGAKNGVWSSNPTAGKGPQVERMAIGESPIDMMSKFQVEKQAARAAQHELPNTRYVATGGTPSVEQKAIIQAIIDKENPTRVVLTNDNDAAGQAFNARYLSDLRPPQAHLPAEVQQQIQQSREQLSWIAGDNGKKGDEKLVTMTMTFRPDEAQRQETGGAQAGQQFVDELRGRAQRLGLPAEEPQEAGKAGLNVRRTAEEQTEVVLRVPPAQANAIVDLAFELRQEREKRVAPEGRTPDGYFVIERAEGKDYNYDVLQGQQAIQLAAARQRAGFDGPEPAPAAAPTVALVSAEFAAFVAQPDVQQALATARAEEAQPERVKASVLVLDNEPLPAGVAAPDNRFGSFAAQVQLGLEEAGATVAARPLDPQGALPTRLLEFDYEPGSTVHRAAQQVLADAQANGPNRLALDGIEAAAEGRANLRYHPGLSLSVAPVALAATENADLLESRLRAGGLQVVPTEVEGNPGLVVLLDRTSPREAAVLAKVEALHETETGQGPLVRESELTRLARQDGAVEYLRPQGDQQPEPPALVASVLVRDLEAGDERGNMRERFTNVGATVEDVELPGIARVSYPLDNAPVAANVSRLLGQMEGEIVQETAWDRAGRQQLEAFMGEPRLDVEHLGRAEVIAAIGAEDATRHEGRVADLAPSEVDVDEQRRRLAALEDQLMLSSLGGYDRGPAPQQVTADIDNNGSTSQEEIIRADANKDGVVTGSELQAARFEAEEPSREAEARQRQQAEEVALEQERQTEEQRQESTRKYWAAQAEREQQEQEKQQQQTNGLAADLAGAQEVLLHRDEPERASVATVSVLEAETLWPGTLATGDTLLQPYGERLREALEQAGVPVTETPVRDPETGQRRTELQFEYQPGSDQAVALSALLHGAVAQGGVQVHGIEAVGSERHPALLERTQQLDQLPLAVVMREPQPEFENRLRETGATISEATVLGRPGLVVLVNEQDANQLGSLARALADKPAGVAVVENPETAERRLAATETAREQGLGGPAPVSRALPEAVPTVDVAFVRANPVEQPAPEVKPVVEAQPAQVAPAPKPAGVQVIVGLDQQPVSHPVERRLVLDVRNEAPGMDQVVEKSIEGKGFRLTGKDELPAQGEQKAGTRFLAVYLPTDSHAERKEQQAYLTNITRTPGVSVHEPENQTKERAEALKGPGQPAKNQLVGAGEKLRGNVTVSEENQYVPDRAAQVYKDLKANGVEVGKIAQLDLGEAGFQRSFPIQYVPTDSRLGKVSAILDAAASAEGVQLTETPNNRLERLARSAARQTKENHEAQQAGRPPVEQQAPQDYAPAHPDAWRRLVLQGEELRGEAGVKALREQFKESGGTVSLQHPEKLPVGSGLVVLSYLATQPQREAIEQVVQDFSARGGQAYDLKAQQDFVVGREPVQAQVPISAEQERATNLAELKDLEARRDQLRAEQVETQREATGRSVQAEAQLLNADPATVGLHPWVGLGPDLRGQDLRHVDATDMDLRGANLAGLDLRQTDLQGADLRGANLAGADLSRLNLTGVVMDADTVLDGAKLEGAFRVVENEQGRRSLQDELTPAILTAPGQVDLALAADVVAPEITAAPVGVIPAVAPDETTLVPAPEAAAGLATPPPVLSLPTEAELLATAVPATPEQAPAAAVEVNQHFTLPTQAEMDASATPTPDAEPSAGKLGLTHPVEPGHFEEQLAVATAERVVELRVSEAVPDEGQPSHAQHLAEQLTQAGAQLVQFKSFELPPAIEQQTAEADQQVTLLRLTYTYDDRQLADVQQVLATATSPGADAGYQVAVNDPDAAGRSQALSERVLNTEEAARQLAGELHDGTADTARLLIQRPSLEDVWRLEEAGASVSRVVLPEGAAALVSYAVTDPSVAGPVSIELDRIERDSQGRPPHNSLPGEISGPLLGEDPGQQQLRREAAQAEGLTLEPAPRYEPQEMATTDGHVRGYFLVEAAAPTEELSGKLASGEQWNGSARQIGQLDGPDRQALLESWQQEQTTLEIIVRQAPEARLPGAEQAPGFPEQIAEALRRSGAEASVEQRGVSQDSGLETQVIILSFANNSPELARIQASLNWLADEPGVSVPPDGFWKREQLLGPNGSQLAQPEMPERERPWLQAMAVIEEPTAQDRRDLIRAGAHLQNIEVEGKPAIAAYYDLDNPQTVAKVSLTLDRAAEEGRLVGEAPELRDARQGRVEQQQRDLGLEREPVSSQQAPALGAGRQEEIKEPAIEEGKMSFIDRLRAAVTEQLEDVRRGWDAASPENMAIYNAHQRGLREFGNAEQQQKVDEAYTLGRSGQPLHQAETKAEQTPPGPEGRNGALGPGSAGSAGVVETEQVIRPLRDNERTVPIQMDMPKEGDVREQVQTVREATAATPGTPASPTTDEKPPVVPTVAPQAAAETTAVTARTFEVPAEWQQGIVSLDPSTKRSATERADFVRTAMQEAGIKVGEVTPPPPNLRGPATMPYAYDPQSEKLPEVNGTLAKVQEASGISVREQPHPLQAHQAQESGEKREALPPAQWPEREGQVAKAHIVIDDRDNQAMGRAEKVKGALGEAGAAVSEAKKDGHGHVEMDVTYHTHSPTIDKLNTTLDKVANSSGIEVRENDADRAARYRGAVDVEQKSQRSVGGPEHER